MIQGGQDPCCLWNAGTGRSTSRDDEREDFFTATIHQPRRPATAFEVNVSARGSRRKSRSVFTSRYLAPTLYAAAQIVTSEYVTWRTRLVESDDCDAGGSLLAGPVGRRAPLAPPGRKYGSHRRPSTMRRRTTMTGMTRMTTGMPRTTAGTGEGDVIRMIGRITQS